MHRVAFTKGYRFFLCCFLQKFTHYMAAFLEDATWGSVKGFLGDGVQDGVLDLRNIDCDANMLLGGLISSCSYDWKEGWEAVCLWAASIAQASSSAGHTPETMTRRDDDMLLSARDGGCRSSSRCLMFNNLFSQRAMSKRVRLLLGRRKKV